MALQLEIELEAKEGDRAEMEEQLSGAFGGVIKELQALAITLTLNLTLTLTHTPTPTPTPTTTPTLRGYTYYGRRASRASCRSETRCSLGRR